MSFEAGAGVGPGVAGKRFAVVVLGVVAVLAATTATSAARPVEPAPASATATRDGPAAPQVDATGLNLGLEATDLATSGRFHLFAEAASDPRSGPRQGRPGAADGAAASAPPRLGLEAALAWNAGPNPVPKGLRMRFKPLTWKDMDSLERTSYALSAAGAVVGAASLLSRLVD